jgi:hypothetical protein
MKVTLEILSLHAREAERQNRERRTGVSVRQETLTE